MRSFFVIVDIEFLAEDIPMCAAKDGEMIETFLLDRLHESFGECDPIGRSDRSSLGFDPSILAGIQERLGVLMVVVDQQDLAFRA
jgi:hypothetical protein